MQHLTDQDQQRVEALLDGQLTGDDAQALRQRAEIKPYLDHAEAQRELRVAVLSMAEPTPAQSDGFVQRTLALLPMRAMLTTSARPSAGADSQSRRATGTQRFSIAQALRSQWVRWSLAAAACVVCFVSGHQWRASEAGPLPRSTDTLVQTIYQVSLTDDRGNVTAVQRFTSPDDAQKFAHDVERWQHVQQEVGEGRAMVVAAQF